MCFQTTCHDLGRLARRCVGAHEWPGRARHLVLARCRPARAHLHVLNRVPNLHYTLPPNWS